MDNIIYEGHANLAQTGGRIKVKGGTGISGFQIVGVGLDAADAVFKVQQTNDGDDVNSWDDTPGASLSPVIGASTNTFALDVLRLGARYFRFDYVPGTNTVGNIKIIVA